MNKKLFAPILSIAALAAVSIGATYALFTDKKEAKVDITAGKVKVALSGEVTEAESRYLDDNPYDALISSTSAIYENGNTASLEVGDDGNLTLELDRMTPMDDITVGLTIENASNVDMKWRLVIDLTDDLIPALEIKIDDNDYSSAIVPAHIVTSWSEVVHPSETDLEDSDLYIAFPDHDSIDPNFDNQYQGKTGHIKISVEAVQGNAVTEDPHETKYGFYDSVLVDEGLETEHWVHQISNVAEFRNIVTNEGNTATPGVMYPGAGEATTVYLIRNNIDFGGTSIWGPDDAELIDTFAFSGILEGANESITLSRYYLSEGLGTTKIMGMFEYAQHATFKNLVLDDFEFKNATGENCGFLAGKTLSDNYDADRILSFENILIKDTCSMEAYKSVGSLMGLARGCVNLTAKKVVNNASVTGLGSGVNVGGLIAQASCGGSPIDGNWTFEQCVNNGDVKILNEGASVAGFVGQLVKKITVTIKDCESNGDLYLPGTKMGYFVHTTTATVKAINFEGTNTVSAMMYTKDGAAADSTKAEVAAMAAQSAAFTEGSRNYSSPNEVMNYVPLTIGFDANGYMTVTSNPVEFDYAVLYISIGDITVDVATNKSTGEGSMGIHNEERNTLDFSDIKKVERIGYFAPNATTTVPTKHVSHYNLAKFFIDYSNRDTLGAGTRYDAAGGFIVVDNTGAVNIYNAINARPDGTELVLYSISLFKNDGEVVGGGKLSTYISGIFEF
ncbi:MAG: SipW-dependent-type signal peptide-containing protein [Bacilli bacterium]|nr:SipW-dependent-type signal peptide-containing protein [Bacilli bacterium]